ncbi:MAG: GHKL domain-containing protein [SAR116 cluster bacterium]|nr:MAG: GHKL domain-containing protein [SAR116 cluster bacterium]
MACSVAIHLTGCYAATLGTADKLITTVDRHWDHDEPEMNAPKDQIPEMDAAADSGPVTDQSQGGQSQVGKGALAEFGSMLDDGLLVVSKDGAVVSANNAAVRFLGEGLVGRQLTDIIPSPGAADVVAGRGRERTFVFAAETSVAMEFKVRIRRMDDGRVIVMLLDMTLQRNLEKVRRDFVANVSHELRSPLTSLAGFIETILLNDVRDWPTQQRFLRIMEEEAGRMSRLIDDLLSLSRVEVDEHIIPDETVPLLEVVKSVIASLETRAAQRGMQIRLSDKRPESSGRLQMFGFADEINEVFHNLIENAIKYGFDNSAIEVDLELASPERVSIAVTNRGETIAEKHINRLTERFYRVDKARSRQIGGTGLGLAIVKHIVNRHRGTMEVSSTADGVTCFAVTLPVMVQP